MSALCHEEAPAPQHESKQEDLPAVADCDLQIRAAGGTAVRCWKIGE